MEKLAAEIKQNKWKRVYLFFGEEKYLIRQYRQRLIQSVLGEDNGMNLSVFEGKDCSPDEIISQAQTMPFFAEHRLILIENSGFLKKSPDQLPEYLDQIPDTAILLFIETEVDKRSRMYKQIAKNGRVVEFARQKEDVLKKWILSMIKKENKKISEPVLNTFLERCGDDMDVISSELEKLFCYTLEEDVIRMEDVLEIGAPSISGHIFQMIDALAEKEQKRAMELYMDLLKLKEPPMRILYLIGRQFHMLLRTKTMREEGKDNREIASVLKIRPFVAQKNTAQASKFSKEQIQKAIEICVSAETDVKSGRINDQMAVELVMMSV